MTEYDCTEDRLNGNMRPVSALAAGYSWDDISLECEDGLPKPPASMVSLRSCPALLACTGSATESPSEPSPPSRRPAQPGVPAMSTVADAAGAYWSVIEAAERRYGSLRRGRLPTTAEPSPRRTSALPAPYPRDEPSSGQAEGNSPSTPPPTPVG